MRHTIIYQGRYSLNFDRLHDYQARERLPEFTRIDGQGGEWDLDPPSRKVDGIIFGYMEKTGDEELSASERFWAVRVQDIVLENPIRLVPRRHTDGKWFGPASSQFEDESARALLSDIIEANPAQRAALVKVYTRYFGDRSLLAAP
jgi:hypothetical protein